MKKSILIGSFAALLVVFSGCGNKETVDLE